MSLIHDYLNKAGKKEEGGPADVPPSLTRKSSPGGEKKWMRTAILAVTALLCAVGALLTLFPSLIQQTGKEVLPPVTPAGTPPVEAPAAIYRQGSEVNPAPPEAPAFFKELIAQQEQSGVPADRNRTAVSTRDAESASGTPQAGEPEIAPEPASQEETARPDEREHAGGVALRGDRQKTVAEMPEVAVNNYFIVALLAQREGRYGEAETFYRAVLQRDPFHRDALINLSAVYIHQRNYDEAAEVIRELINLYPDDPKAQVNLGLIELNAGRYEQARRYFEQAVRLHPEEETALVNLAFLAGKENDYQMMERYYKDILAITPENKDILLAYAFMLEQRERYSEALSCYLQGLEVAKSSRDTGSVRQIDERVRLLKMHMESAR